MVIIVGKQLLAKNVVISMTMFMNRILTIFLMVSCAMEMIVTGILI